MSLLTYTHRHGHIPITSATLIILTQTLQVMLDDGKPNKPSDVIVGLILAVVGTLFAVVQIAACLIVWCRAPAASSTTVPSQSAGAPSPEIQASNRPKKKELRPFFRITVVLSLLSFSVASVVGTFYNYIFAIDISLLEQVDWIMAPFVTIFWFCGRMMMTAIFIGRLDILKETPQFLSVAITKSLWCSLVISCLLFALPLVLYFVTGSLVNVSVVVSYVCANVWDIGMSALLTFAFVRGLVTLMQSQQLLGSSTLLDGVTKFTLVTCATLLSSSVVMIFASIGWSLRTFYGWTVNTYQFLVVIDCFVNSLGLYVVAIDGRHNKVYLKFCGACHFWLQRTFVRENEEQALERTMTQQGVVQANDDEEIKRVNTQRAALQNTLTSVGVGAAAGDI